MGFNKTPEGPTSGVFCISTNEVFLDAIVQPVASFPGCP